MDIGRIVGVALKLIDDVGVDGFTLRMLADSLDSGTATLYRHVDSRDDLLVLVADSVLGEIDVPNEDVIGVSWRQAMTVVAEAFYEVLRRHPNVVPLLAAQVPVGPHGRLGRERNLGLLLWHGFSVRLAARAFTAVGHYVIGFAMQQHGPGAPRHEDQDQLRDYYSTLDPSVYPATRAAANELTSVPLHEEFRFGLDLLLDGLERARATTGALAQAETSAHRT